MVGAASGCASHGGRGVEKVRGGKRMSCACGESLAWRMESEARPDCDGGEMGMTVGQASSELLSARERKALAAGCDVLIDQVFDALQEIKEPQDVAHTTLGLCLPPRYLYKYTPFFCRRFLVCLLTVAWKLAQPKRMLLGLILEGEGIAAGVLESFDINLEKVRTQTIQVLSLRR